MQKIDMLVRGAQLVTAHDQPAISDGAVAIQDGKVLETGPYQELKQKYPEARQELGNEKYLIIPGLINSHGHGRGLSDFQRGALDNTLESWRTNAFKYTPVATYDDVAFSAVRMLKSGVTATMHNHLLRSPVNYQEQFSDVIGSYQDVGVRLLLCPGVRNANPFVYGDNDSFRLGLSPETQAQLAARKVPGMTADEYCQVVKELHQAHQDTSIRIGFGPVAPQWCTADLLQAIKKEADHEGLLIHLHTLQTVFQKVYALTTHGKSYVAYLKDIGLLDKNLILGHCVFPTEKDIELMAAAGTGVTHHPSCNLRTRNGISPAYAMLEAGVNVGLGMDGKTINDDDDLIQDMKVCRLLHRTNSLELDSPTLSNRQVLKMATENGAKLIGFGAELGRLEPGRLADLVLLDYQAMTYPYTQPEHDPVDVLLYRGSGRHVDMVLIGGKVVVKGGEVLNVNEKEIAARLAQAAARPLTEDELAFHRAVDELHAKTIEFFSGWSQKVGLAPFHSVNSRTDGLK